MPLTDSHPLMPRPRRSLARRVAWWLLTPILLLTVIVAAALVAVFQFEQETWGPLAETLVTRATGRSLKIEGVLDAQAGRILRVRAGRISLGNAPWGTREELLVIDGAQVSVDLMRLLDGILVIEDVQVTGADLLFEQDAQGRSNWSMGSGTAQPDSGNERLAAIPLLIAHAELAKVEITVTSEVLTQPLAIRLDRVTQQSGLENALNASVRGAINDRPVMVDARIEPFTQLLAARAVEYRIQAALDTLTVEADGRVDDLLDPKQPTIRLAAESPDITQITSMFTLPETLRGALKLDVSTVPVEDHQAIDIAGLVGPFNLQVQARLQSLDSLDGAALQVAADGPDVSALAALAGLSGLPVKPFKITTRAALTGERLEVSEALLEVGDNRLEVKGTMSAFPKLAGTDLNFDFTGGDYLAFTKLLGVSLSAELAPAPFTVRGDLAYSAQNQQTFNAQATVGDIQGQFRGDLTEYPRFVGSRVEYFVSGPDSTVILRALDRPPSIEGSYVVKGNVQRTEAGFTLERATVAVAENELAVSGTIGEEPLQANTDITARFAGPDLDKIAGVAGYAGFVPRGDAEIRLEARAEQGGIRINELAAKLGRNTLQASGLVSLNADRAGSRLDFAVRGEDIAEVLPPEVLPYVDAKQSYDVAGKLETLPWKLAISTLTARLGEVQLRTSGHVGLKQPLQDSAFNLAASGPDLAAMIPEQLVAYKFPASAFSVSGDLALNKSGLALDDVKAAVGSDRLQLSGLIPLATPTEGLKLEIAASGPDLAALVPPQFADLDIAQTPYEIAGALTLADDRLSVKQLRFAAAKGTLSGDLSIARQDPRAFGRFDLKGSGSNLDDFVPNVPQYQPAAVPFALEARGGWDAERVTVDKGHLELDRTRIDVAGEVDLPPNMAATRLVLSARGDSLADLGEFPGLVLPPEAFSIEASLEQGGGESLVLPKLEARLGESDLRGSLTVRFTEKPAIDVVLNSSVLDLAKLLPALDDGTPEQPPPEPATVNDRVIPDVPAPADELRRLDLTARINVGELRLKRSTLRDVDIDARLQGGELTVQRFRAAGTEGQINARFHALATGNRIAADGFVEGAEIVLGKGDATQTGSSFPPQNARLDFKTAGATTRELAASLNGHLQVTGGAGRMENNRVLTLYGDFLSELFGTVNPFAKREPFTSIACSAVYADIVDGVVTINPGAVVQTDKLNVFADGKVDLKSERIALRFSTSARTGIGVSVGDFLNPFVGVGGKLASPGLTLNTEGTALLEGGVAYATGGMSIVAKGLFDRWFGSKDPCGKLAEQAEKQRRAE